MPCEAMKFVPIKTVLAFCPPFLLHERRRRSKKEGRKSCRRARKIFQGSFSFLFPRQISPLSSRALTLDRVKVKKRNEAVETTLQAPLTQTEKTRPRKLIGFVPSPFSRRQKRERSYFRALYERDRECVSKRFFFFSSLTPFPSHPSRTLLSFSRLVFPLIVILLSCTHDQGSTYTT